MSKCSIIVFILVIAAITITSVESYNVDYSALIGRRIFLSTSAAVVGWFGIDQQYQQQEDDETISRNRFFYSIPVANAAGASSSSSSSSTLNFVKSQSGLQWADAKVGTGPILVPQMNVVIDYVSSTTGARYGSKIYSTTDTNTPYRWTLGDGTTIRGLEEAIVGSADIVPMRPGGIRRIIIPSNLAYESFATNPSLCVSSSSSSSTSTATGMGSKDDKRSIGPIPPKNMNTDTFEAYQRFINIYCNPNRQYQPDVVMDIKLYGKRTID